MVTQRRKKGKRGKLISILMKKNTRRVCYAGLTPQQIAKDRFFANRFYRDPNTPTVLTC